MFVGHVVRVGADHRAVEHSLALPRSLFHEDLQLSGAVLDATFAVRAPALLDQLRARRIPFAVDPESLRFGSDAFLDVKRLAALPYAPAGPISMASSDEEIRRFVVGALEVQAQAGASAYVAPCLPMEGEAALDTNRRLAFAARDAIGVDVDRQPVIVMVAPSTRSLRDVGPVIEMLADVPVDQIHVQPLRFRPTELSLATLDRYCDYLSALQGELDIPVSAGRVGAFGLVLLAIGIGAFDSGLTTAEAFDLHGRIRAARMRRQRREDGEAAKGGRKRRFYLSQIKTTVLAPVMNVVETPQMRYRFTSSLPCCTAGFGGYLAHAREHCLFARTEESRRLLREPASLRPAVLAAQLAEARDSATVLGRALSEHEIDPPSFEHLERWRRLLLARAERVQAA